MKLALAYAIKHNWHFILHYALMLHKILAYGKIRILLFLTLTCPHKLLRERNIWDREDWLQRQTAHQDVAEIIWEFPDNDCLVHNNKSVHLWSIIIIWDHCKEPINYN